MKRQQQQRPLKKKGRIPEIKSREEETQWFDTHDTTGYEDEFKPVRLRRYEQ